MSHIGEFVIALIAVSIFRTPVSMSRNNRLPRGICKIHEICYINCAGGLFTEVGWSILEALHKNPQDPPCEQSIELFVSFEVQFVGYRVPSRWLQMPSNSSISVINLHWDLHSVRHIDCDAFNSQLFRRTGILELLNLSTGIRIDAHAFRGLSSLQTLQLRYLRDQHIPDLLSAMGSVQNIIILNEPLPMWPIDISALTRSQSANNIRQLSIWANLRNNLHSNTLEGLISVEEIDFDSCNIATIPSNAFHAMNRTLRYLSLKLNALKTLPVGVFSAILPSATNIMIDLQLNAWICNCDLRDMQKYLRLYPGNFNRHVECLRILHVSREPISTTDFCQTEDGDRFGAEDYVQLACNANLKHNRLRKSVRSLVVWQELSTNQILIQVRGTNEGASLVSIEVYTRSMFWRQKCVQDVGVYRAGKCIMQVITKMGGKPFMFCVVGTNPWSPLDCVIISDSSRTNRNVWIATCKQVLIGVYLALFLLIPFVVGSIVGAYMLTNFNCNK